MALILLLCVILPQMITAMMCPGVEVHMICHNHSHVLDLVGNFRKHIVVNQLGVLRKDRTLYYSYEPVIDDPEYSKVSYINLDDPSDFGELTSPSFPMNFDCFDFDQANNMMYLCGSNGVKKINNTDYRVSNFSSQEHTIISLFFKDNVYFVRDDDREIVFDKAGALEPLLKDDMITIKEQHRPKESVKKFAIAKDDTVIFLSPEGLFAAKPEMNSKVYMLSKNAFFRGFAKDLYGEVYTWWEDGIYKVVLHKNPANIMVVRVADISDIGALTFDTDNSILYTVEKSLFRLAMDVEVC